MRESAPNVLVIGATSAIAIELLRIYAKDGAQLYLVGRDHDKLQAVGADLLIRGAGNTHIGELDIANFTQHPTVIDNVVNTLARIDIAIVAHGTLTEQGRAQTDQAYLLHEMNVNGLGAISILSLLANVMQRQKSGTLCAISSVAGDRGRKSNYVYGAAKAGVTFFLQGLRNRLAPFGVHVLTVKPGFVITPMTREFTKNFLWVEPSVVAKDIYQAIQRNKDVLYTPWFWRWIMLIIKLIPERIFKKMNL